MGEAAAREEALAEAGPPEYIRLKDAVN